MTEVNSHQGQLDEVDATSFAKRLSQHFVLHAPVAWRERAEIYLIELEHCYAILRRTTGRSGPRRSRIMWRLNTHNAQAMVGGKKSWMSNPLKGLYDSVDSFGRPQFMVHEMLHTFGFNHGSKMTEHQNLGHAEMGLTRWEIPLRLYNNSEIQM